MKPIPLLLSVALLGSFCVAGAAPSRNATAPRKAAAPAPPRRAIYRGPQATTTTSVTTTIALYQHMPVERPDGYDLGVSVSMNGAVRLRTISCINVPAGDAGTPFTQYLLDGAAVASPPTVFQNLCSALLTTFASTISNYDTKMQAALSSAAMQTLLTGP